MKVELEQSDWLFIISALNTMESMLIGNSEIRVKQIAEAVKEQVFTQIVD